MQLGRYKLVREIARSNDIVYEAQDPQMNRRVAVKELLLAPDQVGADRVARIERFYREARAAGQLTHPNIVTIHEVGEDAGRYFIAMEYLEGQTLRERLSVGGPLPLTEAVKIALSLCDALDYAHRSGIVHRDIKPDNVHLLPGGIVKLTDFGIARILYESSLTVAGQVFGTPSYMAPEQIKGLTVDARTDLFALGILLWEMVVGRKPFTGDTVPTITYRILSEPTPSAPGATPALEMVLQRATAKEPNQRFPSAAEFREALMAVAGSRTGVFAAANRTGAFASYATPPAAVPPLTPADFGGGGGSATIQYSAATQLGVAPVAPMAPAVPVAAPQALMPIPVQTRGSYAWLWGALGGAGLVILGVLLAKFVMAPPTVAPSGGGSFAPAPSAPSGGTAASKDPIDSAINSLARSKGIDIGAGSGIPGTSAPSGVAPRVASALEITKAQQAIQNGRQFEAQGRWKEAEGEYYNAMQWAINTDIGNQAALLYNEAQKHTTPFGLPKNEGD